VSDIVRTSKLFSWPLPIEPADLVVFAPANGVLLTRQVPPDAIVWGDAVHPVRWSDR
jgi:putative RNA 2'-phosphotransferase